MKIDSSENEIECLILPCLEVAVIISIILISQRCLSYTAAELLGVTVCSVRTQ